MINCNTLHSYRRDQPQPERGRWREFYQCDFDIAGAYGPMIADAEAVSVMVEILRELPIGAFIVKLSHRCLLRPVFEVDFLSNSCQTPA